MLVAQAPVGLPVGPFLHGHLRGAAAVVPPPGEEGALAAAIEFAVARVAARHELGQSPQEVRRERLCVGEHGELGRRGSQRRSVALPERSHAFERTANAVWTQGAGQRTIAVACGSEKEER
jgi:hypothetical protein